MDYTQFIKAELLLLIPVLYIIGMTIKYTDAIKNNYIPLILIVFGIAFSCLYVFGSEGITPLSIFIAVTQGILCAGGAVLGDQTIKQYKELKEASGLNE